ncbi:hypothetical protein OHD16_10980 [Sphingobacterium sp. ML3W]|uniref:hypothetical protein n=1 Tax=Sphingobacterium sp. ML3W TaxID=1538644 RepID=UPI00249C4260|nr:hypothetical protein [Sphingobacterium sp. ML3W]WFA80486.1 hypothetical protein OGI71_04125 [Sphingobacterium sp. ML3W]
MGRGQSVGENEFRLSLDALLWCTKLPDNGRSIDGVKGGIKVVAELLGLFLGSG